MRAVWVLTLTALNCYSPSPREGVPCSSEGTCPAGQACIAGICGGVAMPDADGADSQPIDAAPIDAVPADAFTACSATSTGALDGGCNTFSGASVFFDVEAKAAPLAITGFETRSQNGGARNISIYYKAGTHVGSEGDASAWTLLGSTASFNPASGSACPLPTTLIPIPFCVDVAANTRVAFLIATTSGTGTIETVSKVVGTPHVEDSSLRVYAGRLVSGAGSPFTGMFTDDKAFEGIIRYRH